MGGQSYCNHFLHQRKRGDNHLWHVTCLRHVYSFVRIFLVIVGKLSSVGKRAQLVSGRHGFDSLRSLNFFAQTSFLQLLKLQFTSEHHCFPWVDSFKKFAWEGRFEREVHGNQFAYCFVSFIILFPGPLQSNSRSHATCYDTLERKCWKAGLWIHGSLSKVSSHKNTVTF